MLRKPVQIDKERYPEKLRLYLENAIIYDSSCSPEARVVFIDKDKGFYLKTAPKGSLKREAEMTEFFAKKGLSVRVLEYISADKDYMLTERVAGEDCTYYKYLEKPERLCDTIAELLRQLHETEVGGCPVSDPQSCILKRLTEITKTECSTRLTSWVMTDTDRAMKYTVTFAKTKTV